MTHHTNGGGLEDCHTNFFALTDLCGIKWRKLVWGDSTYSSPEPLEDPVLSSYAKCLAGDILCVWRRVGTPQPNSTGGGGGGLFDSLGLPAVTSIPPLSLHSAKELWIFWYGEEPDLSNIVTAELLNSNNGAQGAWDNGLSYECRSLLFKALHNLIERCLLSREFVRLGKWFVQPYDGTEKSSEKSSHLSFKFAFFVHGESTVCASVDVRQHPPVRFLNKQHLITAQSCPPQTHSGVQVILAPFGLAGTLTGQVFKAMDTASHRLIEDWRHFYPIHANEHSDVPPVVEVLVGGVKMRYPSSFVLVTDLDETTVTILETAQANNKSSSLPSTGVTVAVVPHHTHHPASMVHTPPAAITIPEGAWLECTLTLPEDNGVLGATSPNSQQPGHWNFTDPHQKKTCSCSRCKKGGGNVSGTRTRTPFHRRPVDGTPSSIVNRSHPSSYSTPYHRTELDSMPPIPSVGSPPSIGPSPLPNPHSTQPPSEPTMPVLSPQHTIQPLNPPSTPLDEKVIARTPSDFHQGPKSVSSVSNQVFSPYTGPNGAPSSVEGMSATSTKLELNDSTNMTTNPQTSNSVSASTSSSANNSSGSTTLTTTYITLKRPVLNSRDYEECLLQDEAHQPSKLLYDYSTLDAWLNHPVKRFKPSEPRVDPPTRGPSGSVLMGGTPHYNSPSPPQFIKQETGSGLIPSLHSDSLSNNTNDPYKFEDNDLMLGGSGAGDNPCTPSGGAISSSGMTQIKEEDIKNSTSNLFTNEGLLPSYKDLENMFENSDDNNSSDEAALQVPTPPGSNKPANSNDDICGNTTLLVMPPKGSGGGGSNINIRPEELSKMFPTPPSLENHPMASPSGGHVGDTPTHEILDYLSPFGVPPRFKQEIYPNMGSPQEQQIEDWSYVFRPPPIAKMVGSSKYAPLTNLPSQNLPPVSIPSDFTYKPSYLQCFSPRTSTPSSSVDTKPNMLPSHSSSQSNSNQRVGGTNTGGMTPNQTSLNNQSSSGPLQSPYPPSPMWNYRGGVRTPCAPPPPYSPATPTASSYFNKNSVESTTSNSHNFGSRPPEAHALVVNILLSDTLLNIFRDHNFDSCTLCVCSTDPNIKVGNIKGADAGVYLPSASSNTSHNSSNNNNNSLLPPSSPFTPDGNSSNTFHLPQQQQQDEDPIRCSCGFSAVVNRNLSYQSGLFLEDEVEITGISEEPVEKEDINVASLGVIDLMREQCVAVHSSCNALFKAARIQRPHHTNTSSSLNRLEFGDTNQITLIALDQGRQAQVEVATVAMCKVEEMASRQQQIISHCGSGPNNSRSPSVHRWPYLRARGPRCNQDIVRIMRGLQPLLQDAIQKKCTTRLWEAPNTVSGPLTWRQFHRLAGRATDDRCEPQPIPSVLVGHEKDWLSISPYALHYWEKLLLEPYSYIRDVAYIVVAPDNDFIIQRTKQYFRDLSAAYEVCKLGRHCPITKVLRDGILRVGKTAAMKLAKEPVDDWFSILGENSTANMLKLYAQVCRHYLAPQLSTIPLDRTLLDPPEGSPVSRDNRSMPSPMPPSLSSMDPSDKAPSTPKSEHDGDYTGMSSANTSSSEPSQCTDDDQCEPPAIVVYLVDPFSMSTDSAELQRLACLGLLRCYNTVLSAIPESVRANISVQIVSLENILELGKSSERRKYCDMLRTTALSVFSQCRRQLSHSNTVKALTGYGTAAMTDLFLKTKDEKNRAPYKVYTPPYILAKIRDKSHETTSRSSNSNDNSDLLNNNSNESSVMYVSYCLSEDQKWLLAGVTDQQGILLDTVTINIHVPNRTRRKKNPARRFGLQKLMDYIIGLMSQSCTPWRLVIGRVGRIGHGELKGWSGLLSRKALQRASKHLKEICNQCSLLGSNNLTPSILSASLVSLEPDSTLRIMPDQVTPDTKFSNSSSSSPLSTPQDVTCTHILVFPTSATTQMASQGPLVDNNDGFGDGDLFSSEFIEEVDPDGIDADFYDIFTNPEDPSLRSPTGRDATDSSSHPGSPSMGMGSADQNMFHCNGQMIKGLGSLDTPEEIGILLQQPLALGYFVSTAPTGRMPKWFWSSCPHLESVCPAFLKSALHMHTTQFSEDLLPQQSSTSTHPLDSTITTAVLRYVLEGYNALSWLAMDSNTQDRLSCLPIHIQVLMQLYHMTCSLL